MEAQAPTSSAGIIHIVPGLLAGLHSGAIGLDVFAKDILVLQCIVAGTSFRRLKDIDERLTPELKLALKREANNKHDEWAVGVWADGQHTGYIPRDKNEVIARLLDAGKTFFAKVREKEWEGNWLRIELDVFLKD